MYCKYTFKIICLQNGSEIGRTFTGEANNTNVITIDATIESDADDYFEVYFAINTNGGTNATIDYNATKLYTYFGGYRIGA